MTSKAVFCQVGAKPWVCHSVERHTFRSFRQTAETLAKADSGSPMQKTGIQPVDVTKETHRRPIRPRSLATHAEDTRLLRPPAAVPATNCFRFLARAKQKSVRFAKAKGYTCESATQDKSDHASWRNLFLGRGSLEAAALSATPKRSALALITKSNYDYVRQWPEARAQTLCNKDTGDSAASASRETNASTMSCAVSIRPGRSERAHSDIVDAVRQRAVAEHTFFTPQGFSR